jgi:hypothetical protein
VVGPFPGPPPVSARHRARGAVAMHRRREREEFPRRCPP